MLDNECYSILGYDEGKEEFKAVIKWTDEKGKIHEINYDGDLDSAYQLLELLTGNCCLADLEP
jgi:hypothetical protein